MRTDAVRRERSLEALTHGSGARRAYGPSRGGPDAPGLLDHPRVPLVRRRVVREVDADDRAEAGEEEDDMIEVPIPEQFCSSLDEGGCKLLTDVSDIYKH